VPMPPSSRAALAGAEILLNLSASNITIGKAETRRRQIVQSGRATADVMRLQPPPQPSPACGGEGKKGDVRATW